MAEEIDKATEARRKALRNGEEDPVIVAQRFLNIYRQRHIFSSERKEAFDKMLLELSPDIRGLFSGLPGGVMLQDYVDDLAEKNGVAKSVRREIPVESKPDENTHQQAQILAAALAQTQNQTPAAPTTVTGKVSMDKDFAEELAKVMNSLIEQQTSMQQQSLEKLALDLSKTQMFLAKMMKEGKEEQITEIKALCQAIAEKQGEAKENTTTELSELCKVLIENHQAGKDELRQELGELCKAIIESQQAGKEAQREEIGELCKVIAQSQTALTASLSNLGKAEIGATQVAGNVAAVADDTTTRKLIELIVEGQKQLNQRLDKVEELSVGRANDNQQLIAVFEKSQEEMIKSLSGLNQGNVQFSSGYSEEKLAQIINESQEKLINTLLTANLQQNNVAQSTNNANNIQITAPDNSAQLLLLVDKIASLQASNEQTLENAITRAIEEQGRLYDKISRQQTKELAEIFAENLKDIARPVVYTMPVSEAVKAQPTSEMPVIFEKPEPGHIPPKMDEEEEIFAEKSVEDVLEEIAVPEDDVAEAMVETDMNSEPEAEVNIAEPEIEPEPEADIAEPEEKAEIAAAETAVGEGEPKKKKKRKRKKKKKSNSEDIVSQEEIMPVETPAAEETDIAEAEIDLPDVSFEDNFAESAEPLLPEPSDIFPMVEQQAEESSDVAPIFEEQNEVDNLEPDNLAAWDEPELSDLGKDIFDDSFSVPLADSSDDWGFGSATEIETETSVSDETTEPVGHNDNNEGEDWEWEYVEDDTQDDYQEVEVIGGNSYIYSSDLYSQEKTNVGNDILYGSLPLNINVRPVIVDNADDEEFIDPYQNSILKD